MIKPTPESIISTYKDDDNFGFVLDLKDLTNFLGDFDPEHLSTKDESEILFRILEYNNNLYDRYNQLLNPSGKSKNIQAQKQSEEEEKAISNASSHTTKTDIYDVNAIIKSICSCTSPELIKNHLPQITSKDYKKIINAILLGLRKKEQEDMEFAANPENRELLEDAKALLAKYHDIYESIIEYDKEQQAQLESQEKQDLPSLTEPKEPKKKKLIFLAKPSGNYYIDSDLESIEESDHIIKLLDDIQNDRVSEIKRYNNEDLYDLLGVRGNRTRIIFANLDSSNVVILGIIIKDFNNNEKFNDYLKLRAREFHNQRDLLLHLKDEAWFIERQEEILEKVKEEVERKSSGRRRDD